MTVPSTVLHRQEDNDFVARTGMLLTGVTGFAYRTGFYLTNSGSYSITSTIQDTSNNSEFINFPSGQKFSIPAGYHKFIPFDYIFVGNNTNFVPPASGPVSGPYSNGRTFNSLKITTTSDILGTQDTEGAITVNITGQVTGFNSLPLNSNGNGLASGPRTANRPNYPTNFKGIMGEEENGKLAVNLRWDHPATGYYLTRYQIEQCIDLTDSSVSTGEWTVLSPYFDIEYSTKFIVPYGYPNNGFNFRQYGGYTGISQRYTAGTAPNQQTSFGEYTVTNIKPSKNYSFRIKGQYVDYNDVASFESDYVYAYGVTTFEDAISNTQIRTDVSNGLISGRTSLPSNDASNVLIPSPAPSPLKIYFNGDKDVELSTKFDTYLAEAGISLSNFDSDDPERLFTGVHFIIKEGDIIGSTNTSNAAIRYSSVIKDERDVEIPTSLILENGAAIMGMGGKGGDGGYTKISSEDELRSIEQRNFKITIGDSRVSTKGLDGGDAVYIGDSAIQKFTIRADVDSIIAGGGGGGGGGDPFFVPNYYLAKQNVITELLDQGQSNLNVVLSNDGRRYTAVLSDDTKLRNVGTTNSFTISEIVGTQQAGPGGGGQGYSISDCGLLLSISTEGPPVDSSKDLDVRYGAQDRFGISPTATAFGSIGGNGGSFGQDGGTPENSDANSFFATNNFARQPKIGGKAGAAIRLIDTNSNYANFNELFFFNNRLSLTKANFPKLIAHFDADQEVYDTGGSAATHNNGVKTWKSVEDPNDIYLIQNEDPNFEPVYYTNNSLFNNKNAIYFDGGATKNIKKFFWLESTPDWRNEIVDSFEITYFLAPHTNTYTDFRTSPWTQFATTGLSLNNGKGVYGDFERAKNARFKKQVSIYQFVPWAVNILAGERNAVTSYPFPNDKGLTNVVQFRGGPLGWGLHNFSNFECGLASDFDPINQPNNHTIRNLFNGVHSKFYDDEGNIVETAGLAGNNFITFNDLTRSDDTNYVRHRPWMYSIAGQVFGNNVYIEIYNDTKLIASKTFSGTSFLFLKRPIIGMATYVLQFYGLISDLALFKTKLTPSERKGVFKSIASKKLAPLSTSLGSITITGEYNITNYNDKSVIKCSALGEALLENSIIYFDNGFIKGTESASVSATTIKGFAFGKISGTGTIYPEIRNSVNLGNNFRGYNIHTNW